MITVQRYSLSWILAFLSIVFLAFIQILGTISALLFLLFGYAAAALYYENSVTYAKRYWVLHILPIYCMLSAFWSNYPSITFRYGVQLYLTLLLGICFCAIFKFEQYVKILAISLGILMVACLAVQAKNLGAENWLGIFGSKNQLAQHAIISVFCSAYFLNKRYNVIVRACAAGIVLLSMFLLIMAHSAGAVVVFGSSYAIMFVFFLVRKLSPATKTMTLFFVGLVSALLYLVSQLTDFSIMNQITDAFGKDRTLTGRTDLWEYANYLFHQNPMLGQGFRGFWVVGNRAAEDLWAMFFVQSGAGFSFHNMYLSNLVDLGLVGMTIQVLMFLYATIVSVKIEVMYGDRENRLVLLYFAYTQIIGLSETPVFSEFTLPSVIYYSFIIYLHRRSAQLRRSRFEQRIAQSMGRRRVIFPQPAVSHKAFQRQIL